MNVPALIPVRSELIQQHLPHAVQLVLRGHLDPAPVLSPSAKAAISKIYRNLNLLCKLTLKQVREVIKGEPAYQQALPDLFLDKKINNYVLITQQERQAQQRMVQERARRGEGLVAAVEYRIQFTLANIGKKSVMRPAVLLQIRTKDNRTVAVYLTADQFALLRQRAASAMRMAYGIELRTL